MRCIQTKPISAVIFCAIASLTVPTVAVAGDESALLLKSREITAQFATELQAALKQSMGSGGPIAAIGACKDMAPQIAADLSRENGATVSRTSLKVRNRANTAVSWQAQVLHDFDAAETPAEYFEQVGKNGARYMKPIPTGGLCLACHGSELSPDIRDRLDEAYPGDQARGYNIGDIRGAFSVVWADQKPANE
jgi:hypothetical protein